MDPKSAFAPTNGIRLHYLDHGGSGPVLVLMHGLTANAHAFDDYVSAGLTEAVHLLTVDLRGRGLSDKPPAGYTMNDHMRDILGLLDALGLEQVILGGHSFGALVSIYTAAHHPGRVSRLVLVDSAARLHPDVRELVAPAVQRLGRSWPSFADYLEEVQEAPFLKGRWQAAMESYYRADVRDREEGEGVTTRSSLPHIQQAIEGALGLGAEWLDHIRGVSQPAILVNATGPYGDANAPALLPKELALETVHMMQDCRYVEVPGNHFTMLYGEGARATVAAIEDFVSED